MSSLFTKIYKGEIPSYKIAEDDNFFAFLDIYPIAKGHTLVIPKKEIENLFDLDNESYTGLWLFAKKIAVAMKKTIPCKRIGVAVVGLEVPHAHINLVPINDMNDFDFTMPKLKFSKEEFEEIAIKISHAL